MTRSGTAAAVSASQPAMLSGAATTYEITCVTSDFALPFWRGEWRRLLAASTSPEKIYQTPEFFRFLFDSQERGSDRFELYAIKDCTHGNVVGMIPVRISGTPLAFQLGSLRICTFRPRIVRILGSVPLMPDDTILLHQLFAHLLKIFPKCAAVSMQAYPVEMKAYLHLDPAHVPYLTHGWRECHTIPLPDDFPAYMARINAKKRYNLARQYRLLEQATGPLTLLRIDQSAQVQELADGIVALTPGGDGLRRTNARDYRVLAANRLLLSYVLRSADAVVAVITGTRYGDTWHVHQILYAPQHRHLSAGAVVMHAALEDVITHFTFTQADFGFGEPGHRFASTHVLKRRAHVLMARAGGWHRLLFATYVRYEHCHAACVRSVRDFMQRLRARKAAP
jgi:CelD/BcsL family acetyltransferase involved in cellulose biosynthesis